MQAYAKGQSEVVMGEAIKELGWKRSDVVLSTKIFWVSSARMLIGKMVHDKQRNQHIPLALPAGPWRRTQ